MTQQNCRRSQIAIFFVLACHAVAQTMPPPGTIKTLYRYTINSANGDTPLGGLILGDDGNLYGTTSSGGDKSCRCGTIFRITTDGTLTTIFTFTGGATGGPPNTPMVKDRQGNLYGTTGSGISRGTAFRITPGGDFTSFTLPGSRPNGLLYASDGNLYGTTADFASGSGYGTFYRISPDGEVTLLHRFDLPSEGISNPSALAEGPDGNFYGIISGRSQVFRITPAGDPTVVFKALAAADVGFIDVFTSSLTRFSDGNFYGAARDGVYTITPSGSFNKLIRFADVGLPFDSGAPIYQDRAALLLGDDGKFYGTTQGQTTSGVYQISSGGAYQLIYVFPYAVPGTSMLYPEGTTPSRLTQGPDGLYGTTGSGGGAGLGGTVFKIMSSGGGTPAPPPPPTTRPTIDSLTAFDPNTPDLWRVVPLFGAIGTLPWDQNSYQALAGVGPPVTGLVADGLTPVVLRVHASAQDTKVTFTITDSTCPDKPSADPPCDNGPEQVGSLCQIDSTVCTAGPQALPVAVQTFSTDKGQPDYMAFALLQAPLDFVRPSQKALDSALGARRITVTATVDGAAQSQRIFLTLERPPVVLLHGIWSSSATWDWPIQRDQRFHVYAQDYFDTRADPFVDNLDKPAAGIARALQTLRAAGVAATQADLVGHSMGGLLARLYAGGYSLTDIPLVPYRRNDNLGAGDLHKLITLDTPHKGSELANQLVDAAGNATRVGSDLQSALNTGEARCITCGAVFDLRVGSPPISQMPAIDVPSHAIVGVGGNAALSEAGALGLALLPVLDPGASFLFIASTTALGLEAFVFGGSRHDLIVSEESQRGTLTGSAVTTFEAEEDAANCAIDISYGLTCSLAIHMTVTKEARIGTRVIDLLNAPVHSESFGYF